MQKHKFPTPMTAEVGLVLMDLSLNLIACDRGAASILNYPAKPESSPEVAATLIPLELLELLRSRKPTDSGPLKTHIRIGLCEYVCRAYVLEGSDGIFVQQPVVALHLERDLSASDAAYEVGTRYHLTEREMEALKGILIGLGSKEVAERMNISPNTVKAFLRLIMIKMGVTTRAGIVAKVLQNRATPEEQDGAGNPVRPRPKRKEAATVVGVAKNAGSAKASGERWHDRIGDPAAADNKIVGRGEPDMYRPGSGGYKPGQPR
jgi:DNA-binding CsgD family transcriptional regulator